MFYSNRNKEVKKYCYEFSLLPWIKQIGGNLAIFSLYLQRPRSVTKSILLDTLWVHFFFFLFAYIWIEIWLIIYYMYDLTATRKNTRNNSFSVSKLKKDKIGKSLLIEFLSNLASQTFLERIKSLL